MSAENMPESMWTDLPDILCHNNPDLNQVKNQFQLLFHLQFVYSFYY